MQAAGEKRQDRLAPLSGDQLQQQQQQPAGVGPVAFLRDFFDLHSVRGTLAVCWTRGSQRHHRLKLGLLLALVVLVFGPSSGRH